MACNDSKNPLQHNGTSQSQRRLPALPAAYVQVDERRFPDWISFASRFAQYLNYYNEANIVTNNWQPFFNNDIAAVLGSVAIQNIDDYRRQVKERLDILRDDENEGNEAALKETLGSLFSAMLTLGLALDGYLFRLPQAHPFHASLQNTITQKLQPSLKQLLAYYKGGMGLIANKDYPEWQLLGRPVRDVQETVHTKNLSAIWLEGKDNLKLFFNSIAADKSIYGAEAALPYQRIRHAANHNLFVALFDQFLSSYAGLIAAAEASLLDALSSFNSHPPHYALFLAFLQLYRFAQDELNLFTQRHLDFYYQSVLRLSPKKALPNSAHLVMELAKGVADFSLPKGTLLRAGKDSLGKEVFYALDKETVFNQANVSRLMSVYRGISADNIKGVQNAGRLFAAPVANSADGLGKEINTPAKAWHPFVQKTFEDGVLTAINMPKAAIGFAIASPYLLLAEGDREIQVLLQLAPVSTVLPAVLLFDAYLTTAKGWLPVPATASVESISKGLSDAVRVTIALDGNAPAITGYEAKVHGGTFGQAWPLLKLYLRNEDNAVYPYNALKDLRLKTVGVSVFVGVDSATGNTTKTGVKNLQLSNEFGALDPAKPFQPFGFSPKKGSAFIMGSEELFKKPGAAFQLKMKWLDLPKLASDVDYEAAAKDEGNLAPEVTVAALSKGAWTNVLTNAALWSQVQRTTFFGNNIFGERNRKVVLDKFGDTKVFPDAPLNVSAKGAAGAYLAYDQPYGPYTVQRTNGYLKLTLEEGFGYDDYQKAYAKYLVDSVFGSGTNPGEPPYVPKLESISMHYSASATTDITTVTKAAFENKAIAFYHLAPFGEAEQHAYLAPGANLMLLPQLATRSGAANEDSGELYIGLVNLAGLQAVNLLFGVLEGTSDPLTAKPEKHVTWSYLSHNQWKDFEAQSISDGTAQLIQTGIISFTIPEDATTDNTLLPAGFLWLRAGVNSAVMAVCQLLNIDAQAAVATFSDNGNAVDFLNVPLPAATIAKLKTPVAAIKKITQPYAAFGGRPAEESEVYYTRVSERLRHKERALAIWDYEHLILEAFPQLHRVKCLSHTALEQLPNGAMRLNEMAPGHVTIITIPSLQNTNLSNPLRPYTSESMLAQIADFVKARTSCHVAVQVVHPTFEEVALDFKLRLMPGYDDFTFYAQRLKEEITAFLTPWAFSSQAEVHFGGRVSKSVLINFIEEQPFVDYISHVKLYHRTEAAPNSLIDLDEITASSGRAILVSVPASKHVIVNLPAAQATDKKEACTDPYNAKYQ